MHKRTAGIILICIAAFLYGIRYISAAILGSIAQSWDSVLFDSMLIAVGKGPVVWSILALIAGIVYLIRAELESSISKYIKEVKENWNNFDTDDGKE